MGDGHLTIVCCLAKRIAIAALRPPIARTPTKHCLPFIKCRRLKTRRAVVRRRPGTADHAGLLRPCCQNKACSSTVKWPLVWGPIPLSGVQVAPDAIDCSWRAKARTRPNLFIWFSGALEPLGCSLRAKARGRDRHLPVNQLCKGKDDNGAATPSVHLIQERETDKEQPTNAQTHNIMDDVKMA